MLSVTFGPLALAVVLGLNQPFLAAAGSDSQSLCCEMKYHWETAPQLPPNAPPYPIAFGEDTLTLIPERAAAESTMRVRATDGQFSDLINYGDDGRESGFAAENGNLIARFTYPSNTPPNATDVLLSTDHKQLILRSTKTENGTTHEMVVSGQIFPVNSPNDRVNFEETIRAGLVVHASFDAYHDSDHASVRVSFTLQQTTQSPVFAFPLLYLSCLVSRESFYSNVSKPLEACFPGK